MSDTDQPPMSKSVVKRLQAQGADQPVVAKLTRYERDVIRSAKENHIWLNAFACVRPTSEFKIQLADQILAMLNDKDYLINDYQDSDSEALKEIGRLTPELVVRINKS